MTDKTTVRLVIGTLALLAALVVVGGIYLTAVDRSLPGELIAIGSASAGAVAGILSRTSTGDVQQVVGPQGGPLPVVDETGHVETSLVFLVAAFATIWMAIIFTIWAFESGPFA